MFLEIRFELEEGFAWNLNGFLETELQMLDFII